MSTAQLISMIGQDGAMKAIEAMKGAAGAGLKFEQDVPTADIANNYNMLGQNSIPANAINEEVVEAQKEEYSGPPLP